MSLSSVAADLIAREGRGDTPFGLYALAAQDPAAELGRAVEREVFYEYFGNTPELLADEYDPFEAASLFLVVVDHLRRRPAGVMRILVPTEAGFAGFKSVLDLERAWGEPWTDVLDRTPTTFDPARTWDVATLAVTGDYRGAASAGLVSLALYQGLSVLALRLGIDHVVAIMDLVVLDLAQNGFHRAWNGFPGLAPKRYLDSPSSLPVYCDVREYEPRLSLIDPAMHAMLFEGTGLETAVSIPAWHEVEAAPAPARSA